VNATEAPSCPIPSLGHLRARKFLDVRAGAGVESSWGVTTDAAVVFECPATGLRFRLPAAKEEIERFYGPSYHERMAGEEEPARRAAYRAENEARIAYLRRFCPGGKVLDVGCSTGVFASQLAAAGYQALGSDISAYACEQAAEALGPERVFAGPLEAFADELEGSLDAITLMDVIEHFDDVVHPLETMRAMLKPEGVLFLRTPTLSSPFYKVADLSYRLSARRYTDAVLKIYHAEHFFFFNERSIRQLLEDTGYEVLAVDPDPLRWDNFRSAELRHGALVNAVLGAVYFAGRLVNRGHGMKVVARPRTG
jgi:2-polyprenyl-3-methyl-5-hydroxy-6-metoxy-1,4-benzoquinol methylase